VPPARDGLKQMPQLACLVTTVQHDATRTTPGCLPAILLTDNGEPDTPHSYLRHLVSHGWAYAEPPIQLTPIRAIRSDADTSQVWLPLLLVPCPPPDERTLTRCGRPTASPSEWWQRVRDLGQRCAVVLTPTLDLRASDLPSLLNREASRGHIVWTTVQMTSTGTARRAHPNPVLP
jgi:hypothetical protein